MSTITKMCQGCEKHFKINEFGYHPKAIDNIDIYCKPCRDKEGLLEAVEKITVEKIIPNIESKSGGKPKINQIDKETKEIINTFDSPKLAGEGIGKNPMSIRRVLRIGKGVAHGFNWAYTN